MKNVLITLTMSALMLGSTVTVAVTERSALDEYLKKEQWQAVTLPASGEHYARDYVGLEMAFTLKRQSDTTDPLPFNNSYSGVMPIVMDAFLRMVVQDAKMVIKDIEAKTFETQVKNVSCLGSVARGVDTEVDMVKGKPYTIFQRLVCQNEKTGKRVILELITHAKKAKALDGKPYQITDKVLRALITKVARSDYLQ